MKPSVQEAIEIVRKFNEDFKHGKNYTEFTVPYEEIKTLITAAEEAIHLREANEKLLIVYGEAKVETDRLQNLIDGAEGLPEKKSTEHHLSDPYGCIRAKGYNEALDDCTPYLAKLQLENARLREALEKIAGTTPERRKGGEG